MRNSTEGGSPAITRRRLLVGGVAGAAPLFLAGRAGATIKVPQSAVHFETVASTDRNCGACKHFLAPSSCRFVEGTVSTGCGCWIWAGKVV